MSKTLSRIETSSTTTDETAALRPLSDAEMETVAGAGWERHYMPFGLSHWDYTFKVGFLKFRIHTPIRL